MDKAILRELSTDRGGRLAILELPAVLDLKLGIIDERVPKILQQDRTIISVQGELLTEFGFMNSSKIR